MSVLAPEFLRLVPGFFSNDMQAGIQSLESPLRMCVAREIPAAELYMMLGWSISTPPYVREALLFRSLDNDDLLPKIRKPVLITHGAKDAVVNPAVVDQHKASLMHAEIQLVNGAGHAPFWDERQPSTNACGSFPPRSAAA